MGGTAAESQANLQALEQVIEPSCIYSWQTLEPTWQERLERVVPFTTAILGVVYPTTALQLATVMQCAQQHRWQVLPCGAGSKLDWGGLVQAGDANQPQLTPLLLVSTERMNRLVDHAVGDLTVTVEAGMRFADLQAILATANQFLAIDPAYPDQATIGGIVATADTGSLRQRYSSVRDMLLGISLVRADGEIAKAGGRVVKNVAGYDLMKLFTGSYGTLGVITELTFRVYPRPETGQTVVLTGEAAAIARATTTLRTAALTPAAVDILSPQTAPVLNLTATAEMALLVRFEGIAASVQQQTSRTIELGQALGLVQLPGSGLEDALWQTLRKHMTGENGNLPITCKIGVRPSNAVAVLTEIEQVVPANLPWYGQIHAASGIGRLAFAAAVPPTVLLQVRSLCQANHGFLSVLKAPISLKQQMDVWGYVGNALPLMRRIKHQFDPDSRLSPI